MAIATAITMLKFIYVSIIITINAIFEIKYRVGIHGPELVGSKSKFSGPVRFKYGPATNCIYSPSKIEDSPLCNSQLVLLWHLTLHEDGKQITFCKYKVFN